MIRSVALLRAINVGGHNIKMDDLRKLFESLGFSNVETFIASGNVLFDSPEEDEHELGKRIESCLREALGYEVATFIRSGSEMAEVANREPFPAVELAAEGASLYVAFLKVPPSEEATQKLMNLRSEVDDFQVRGREVYWLCRIRMSESAFSGAVLEKTLGMLATLRNSTTVRKLAAKAAG
jgi:uncharacterized protein (DUF1697 family)